MLSHHRHWELLVHRVVTGVMTELAWWLSRQSWSLTQHTKKLEKYLHKLFLLITSFCYNCACVYSSGNNRSQNDSHQWSLNPEAETLITRQQKCQTKWKFAYSSDNTITYKLNLHDIPSINLLMPTSHVMHQEFNIQQMYAVPTLYLCVLYLSENKQRLVPLTALTDWFL